MAVMDVEEQLADQTDGGCHSKWIFVVGVEVVVVASSFPESEIDRAFIWLDLFLPMLLCDKR